MKVFLNLVHRQLTLPRAVCLAGSAGVAPKDVARVATAHQAFTMITIMLINISIVVVTIIEINDYIETLRYIPF